MACKCKCYCFCIYGSRGRVCNMINMKLKHCRMFELLVAALGVRAIIVAANTSRIRSRLILLRIAFNITVRMRWKSPVCESVSACAYFVFGKSDRHWCASLFFLYSTFVGSLIRHADTHTHQFWQFANDPTNLWDGSIINFMCERKHFCRLRREHRL